MAQVKACNLRIMSRTVKRSVSHTSDDSLCVEDSSRTKVSRNLHWTSYRKKSSQSSCVTVELSSRTSMTFAPSKVQANWISVIL